MSASSFGPAGLAYLKARGIDPDVAARIGAREDRGELVWPTVDVDGRPAPRRRTLNGAAVKVRGAHGVSPGLWWPAGPPRQTDGTAVLLCEGESDALAALTALELDDPADNGATHLARRYISAVAAMPGTSFPRDRLVAALRTLGVREVVLALDADEAGRRAAADVARVLREVGITPMQVPLPDGTDLAECLAGETRPAAWMIDRVAPAAVEADAAAADTVTRPLQQRLADARVDLLAHLDGSVARARLAAAQ